MDRKEYINYLTETSDMVMPIILDVMSESSLNIPDLDDLLSFLSRMRMNRPLLKPTLFRLSYEACGGKDFEKFLPFAAACELLNISSYQANASFDNKLGVLSKKEKDNQVIAAMISRELASQLASRLKRNDIDSGVINELCICLTISNLYIYKAQHYDLNVLSVSNQPMFEKYISDRDLFLQDYHTRCYYGSGIFSGQVALAGAIAAGADEKYKNSLREFGEIYGTALHKINDLGDFLPGDERNGKQYQDYFCDFKNERLTLPVYELYTRYQEVYSKMKCLLNEEEPNYADVHGLFVSLDVVDTVKKIAKGAYVAAKKSIENIPLSEHKRGLLSMLSVLKSNKYYHRASM